MHNNAAEMVLKRPKGSREKKATPCPVAVIDYNNYMGGVHGSDGLTFKLLFAHN